MVHSSVMGWHSTVCILINTGVLLQKAGNEEVPQAGKLLNGEPERGIEPPTSTWKAGSENEQAPSYVRLGNQKRFRRYPEPSGLPTRRIQAMIPFSMWDRMCTNRSTFTYNTIYQLLTDISGERGIRSVSWIMSSATYRFNVANLPKFATVARAHCPKRPWTF